MNTGWLSCTSSKVMANKACLVVLLVYVRETLIFERLQMVSFCLFFFVFSFVCLFVFLTERYHKRFSVVITFFANVCDTHDRIFYIKSSDSQG